MHTIENERNNHGLTGNRCYVAPTTKSSFLEVIKTYKLQFTY